MAAAMYKYRKLRGRIVEKYGTIKDFSAVTGISEVSVSKKLNGRSGMSQKDIAKWCKLLDIDNKDIPDYFFA